MAPIALIPLATADTVPRAQNPLARPILPMDELPAHMRPERSFQGFILALQRFWAEQGCVILQPYDMEMGAGTFHPATTLRALGPKPWRAAYVQPSRRPKDGRYGKNPNRMQHYYQYQVIMKPSPPNLQELYLKSLAAIGLDSSLHDIRFVEDDWESPTLGAWGLGWECWCDGMEVSQFTYFQQVAGVECAPVAGELTYGMERLACYLQGVDHVMDLNFNGREGADKVTYGDVFLQAEQEYSLHNFEHSDSEMLFKQFVMAEEACKKYLAAGWKSGTTSTNLLPSLAREARGGEGSGVGGARCRKDRNVKSTSASHVRAPCAVTRPKPKRSCGNICGSLRSRSITFDARRPSAITSPTYASHQANIVIELDGGQPAGSASDQVRTNYLEANGYRVLRFWNNDVLQTCWRSFDD